MSNHGDWQPGIYLGGLAGTVPELPTAGRPGGRRIRVRPRGRRQAGIEHALRCLLAETDLTVAVDGHPRAADLTAAGLHPVG